MAFLAQVWLPSTDDVLKLTYISSQWSSILQVLELIPWGHRLLDSTPK